jgi:molybdate transport system substrate-binding protein
MGPTGSRLRWTLAVLPLLASTVACAGSGSADGERTLAVYAASSLTGAFEELAERFEAEHPGVEVALTFGGSSDLVAQVDQGAPADVVATADEVTMGELVSADLVGAPRVFATNTLQIAVPPDNPAGVTDLEDLAGADVRLVVCAPAVPCGSATQQLAEAVGVALQPVSEEQAVTDVLGKVRTGEADAGIVYVTDVAAAGDEVRGIEVPEAADVVSSYPVAPVAASDEGDLGADFVELVLGQPGQDVLAELGFGPAPKQP